MPKFKVRFITIVDRFIEAFDVVSAERQAKFVADGLRVNDSYGESKHASLYSIEKTKETDEQPKPLPPDPRTPKPQRRFAA